MTSPRQHNIGRTAALCVAVLLFLLSASCGKKKNDLIPNLGDRKTIPGMKLDSVTTLISDSGVIRYRVVAEKWDAYDKADDPYWLFPRKVYFERFNDTLVIESTVEADTAWYYYDKKLWILKQNVKVLNLTGERFTTTLPYWSQEKHRVWSDTSFIRIEQDRQVITGHGFESNEQMTKYTINEIVGIFPMDREGGSAADTSSVAVPVTLPSGEGRQPSARQKSDRAAGRNGQAPRKEGAARPETTTRPGQTGRIDKQVTIILPD